MKKNINITQCPYKVLPGSKINWCEDMPNNFRKAIQGGYWVKPVIEYKNHFFSSTGLRYL